MTVQAIYEMGTLRLFEQLALAEGTKVELSITVIEPVPEEKNPLKVLKEISELPLEGNLDNFSGQDHDQVLYS